jgi:hypothetical protein
MGEAVMELFVSLVERVSGAADIESSAVQLGEEEIPERVSRRDVYQASQEAHKASEKDDLQRSIAWASIALLATDRVVLPAGDRLVYRLRGLHWHGLAKAYALMVRGVSYLTEGNLSLAVRDLSDSREMGISIGSRGGYPLAECTRYLAHANLRTANWEEAATAAIAAGAEMRRSSREEDALDCLLLLARARTGQQLWDDAQAAVAKAIEGYAASGDTFGMARAHHEDAQVHLGRSDYTGAEAALRTATALFKRCASSIGQADCLARLAVVRVAEGRLPEAEVLLVEAQSEYQGGRLSEEAAALSWERGRALILAQLARKTEALAVLSAVADKAEALGLSEEQALAQQEMVRLRRPSEFSAGEAIDVRSRLMMMGLGHWIRPLHLP